MNVESEEGIASNLGCVSVIIPTFKRPELLARAIKSVLVQTYENIEIIVVDDSEECEGESVCSSFNDSRIRYVRNIRTKGACGARNTGIFAAQGFFYAGLDDDDEFTPDRISNLLAHYSSNISFVASNMQIITREKSRAMFKIGRSIGLDEILWGNCIGTQILTERERVLSLGGFDERLSSGQDADLWVRLIESFGPAKRIKDLLYVMHTEHDAPRISISDKKIIGMKDFLAKHGCKMNSSQRSYYALRVKKYEGCLRASDIAISLLDPSCCFVSIKRLLGLW